MSEPIPPTTPPDGMPVALLEWKPFPKGALCGFASIRLGRTLVIHDVPVLQSHGRAWAGLPGKPLIGTDGIGLRDEKGRQRYARMLEWTNRQASDRFSEAVVSAVRQEHGADALGAAGSA
jgi:hypothetical protein